MRDERHIEKFFYLGSRKFYEPLYLRYTPRKEFITIVRKNMEDLNASMKIIKDQWWWHVYNKNYRLPDQGWKIHISATLGNCKEILYIVSAYLLQRGIPFKFLLDSEVLILFNLKNFPRGSSGKFITVYPLSEEEFKEIIDSLYNLLKKYEGPYILSDRRYKDSKVLYYRYGGINRISIIDVIGRQIPVITSPAGEYIRDERRPFFKLPKWVNDPFNVTIKNYQNSRQKIVLRDRYVIKEAISFSNSGGVYMAIDKKTRKKVIIKEARPHTSFDRIGNDSVSLLKKEYQILREIRDLKISPRPLNFFKEWEHFFMVETYESGFLIRRLIFRRSNPLFKISRRKIDSKIYFSIFKKVFYNYAINLRKLHDRKIVFGDISINNLLIDDQYYVILVDFESAERLGIDIPVNLYTIGFRKKTRKQDFNRNLLLHKNPFSIDNFGLASMMLYFIFPISVLFEIRDDLFENILSKILKQIGWPKKIFELIKGLSEDRLNEDDVINILGSKKNFDIKKPNFEIRNFDSNQIENIKEKLYNFIINSMTPNRNDRLFPGDAFLYVTNPLSLGFGAIGVIYSLVKSGFSVPDDAIKWVKGKISQVNYDLYPPGLLTGMAGLVWGLWEVGLYDESLDIARKMNSHPMKMVHHSYYYGISGIGLTNLFLYLKTGTQEYLDEAYILGENLIKSAKKHANGYYWYGQQEKVHLGLAYGQAGVALFLLRLYELTDIEKFFYTGLLSLSYDFAQREFIEKHVISFKDNTGTYEPHVEVGSAGIAKVALRYGFTDEDLEYIANDVFRKYAVFSSISFGLGGFIDTLIDYYYFTNKAQYLEMAKLPLTGLEELYFVEENGEIAIPGDGLLRFSADYLTGASGIMRVLHRMLTKDHADFMLDEIYGGHKL